MNKSKFAIFIVAALLMPTLLNAKSVDVYDEKYEGFNQVSFVVGQGDVETQVYIFLERLYPDAQILFKNSVKGFLLAEVEISGASVENVATDMLAGLGLSACHYANNVIEVGAYKKRGVCPVSKLPSGDRPKVKRFGDGIFSITNEWFGDYSNQGVHADNRISSGVINASYTSSDLSDSNTFDSQNSDQELLTPDDSPANELGPNTLTLPSLNKVEFTMTRGILAPQIRNLVSNLKNAPEVVWELDENTQWFNNSVIRRGTYIEIFADILDSYNAFADFYENNVIVVRNGDFQ
jgi:hypothetical protein